MFGDRLLTVHVVLGLTILTLAAVRLYWRRRAGLPPWAKTLSTAERTLAHWTERALYLFLFVVPVTGLWLIFVSDDAVPVHIASHIAIFVAIHRAPRAVLKHELDQPRPFAAPHDLNVSASRGTSAL